MVVVGLDEVWLACGDNKIRVYSSKGDFQPTKLITVSATNVSITGLATCQDIVWACTVEGFIFLIDKNKRMEVKKIFTPVGSISSIQRVTNKATGKEIIWIGSSLGVVSRYDSQSYVLLDRTEAHKGIVHCVLHAGDKVWTSSSDSLICIFNAESGKLEKKLEGHMGRVFSLVSVGDYVWSCSFDKQIYLWHKQTYQCHFMVVDKHTDSIRCLAVVRKDPNDIKNDRNIQVWSGSASNDGSICIFYP